MTFKNVPLNVRDEEILTLCAAYGRPADNTVQYERPNNIRVKNLSGSTRFVDMEFDQGKSFDNFYSMEGPLQGDTAEEEEFEFVEDAENVQDEPSEDSKVTHRSRKDLFMSSIEHKVDKTNSMQQEQLSHIRNQVQEGPEQLLVHKARGPPQ